MFRTAFAALVVTAGLLAAGCANKDGSHDHKSASMKDACRMCAGDQTATADGKCPKCGMSVQAMKDASSKGDCCDHCPGTQTMSADGTCPMCHGKANKM